jgi:hypothetical protein
MFATQPVYNAGWAVHALRSDQNEEVVVRGEDTFDFIEEFEDCIIKGNDWAEDMLDSCVKKAREELKIQTIMHIDDDDETEEVDEEGGDLPRKYYEKEERIISNVVDGVNEEGIKYFDHCSNHKIQTICEWGDCIRCNGEHFGPEGSQNIREIWGPIRYHIRALSDPEVSIPAKRKILSKSQVGSGVASILASTLLPFLRQRKLN